MRAKRMLSMIGLALLVVLAILVVGSGPPDRSISGHYEYCCFMVLQIENESRCVFFSERNDTTAARDIPDLCKKLGIKGDGSKILLLNTLGTRGWHLVSIDDEVDAEGKCHIYYLERFIKRK